MGDATVEVTGKTDLVKVIARGPAGPEGAATPKSWFVYDTPDLISVASDSLVALPWIINPDYPSTQDPGDTPFDLTDPLKAVVKEDGNYTVQANCQYWDTPGAPCFGRFQLFLDPDGLGLNYGETMYLSENDWNRTISIDRFMPAGSVLWMVTYQASGAPLRALFTSLVSWEPTS